MKCPNCQADNLDEHRFCEQCGSPLELRCPQCKTSVRPGARFCGACGHRLAELTGAPPTPPPQSLAPVSAPTLDYHSRLTAYTPKHLADKILTSRSALEGERRQVTVLFADVAGFTTLSEHRDPEEVHAIMDRCFE